ncbi:MAG: CapA family protein [Candidatus Doudnabacteria bacterium]
MKVNQLTLILIKYVLPLLALLAAGLGLYQWQFNQDTLLSSLPKNSDSDLQSLEDYYQASQSLTPQTNTTVTLNAVGDIMLSRQVARNMNQNQQNGLWPYQNIEQILLESDFNFGNLESPFSGNNNLIPPTGLEFNAPTYAIDGLKKYNFKVLSLANNHVYDQGDSGVTKTQDLLIQNDIIGVGTGQSKQSAWSGGVKEINGVKIGFLAATYGTNKPSNTGQTTVAKISELQMLNDAIIKLKSSSDFVIVSMHAGTEYTYQETFAQTNFAHQVIQAGADMVIGHHPHWIQPIEQYQGKYIFYSLGNFIFDQMWSQNTKEGLLLQITLESNIACIAAQPEMQCSAGLQGSTSKAEVKSINLVPIIIENFGQPRPASSEEATNILQKINIQTTKLFP